MKNTGIILAVVVGTLFNSSTFASSESNSHEASIKRLASNNCSGGNNCSQNGSGSDKSDTGKK